MVKTESTLRVPFFTRLQLFLWEVVIVGVDLVRQVRDGLQTIVRLNIRSISKPQAGFLLLFLVIGALGGLTTGAVLACLSLIW